MIAGPVSHADDTGCDAADAPQRVCERCGYDLRELPQDRCPECGLPFDPGAAPTPQIPWLRRRRTGAALAFWQTVWLATFSPRKFAAEFMRANRVASAEARQFGRRCVWLAVLSVVVVSLAASLPSLRRNEPNAVVLVLASAVAAWVFFEVLAATTPFDPLPAAVAGEHPWLMALNAYASAPLAFSPVPAAAAVAGLVFLRTGGVLRDVGQALLLLAAAGAVAQFVMLAVSGVAMLRQVRRFGIEDTVWSALVLPFRWVGIVVLTSLVMLVLACPLAALASMFS